MRLFISLHIILVLSLLYSCGDGTSFYQYYAGEVSTQNDIMQFHNCATNSISYIEGIQSKSSYFYIEFYGHHQSSEIIRIDSVIRISLNSRCNPIGVITGDYYGVKSGEIVCFMSFYPDFSFSKIDTYSNKKSSGIWHQNSEAEVVTYELEPNENRSCYQWIPSRSRLIKSCGRGALILRKL